MDAFLPCSTFRIERKILDVVKAMKIPGSQGKGDSSVACCVEFNYSLSNLTRDTKL